jgi:hypothetical protein
LSSSSTSTKVKKASPKAGDDVPWLHRDSDGDGCDDVIIPRFGNFVNGTFQSIPATNSSISFDDIPVIDPSTNEVLSYVPTENAYNAVSDAVIAAKNAYPEWSNTPVQVRQRLLAEYANVLHRKEIREEIA